MKRHVVILFLQIFLLSAALFVLGLYLYLPIFMFFEPEVDGVRWAVTDGGEIIIQTSILFSLVLALVPVLVRLTWHLAAIDSATRKFAAVLTILAFMIIAIWIRHLAVKTYFTWVAKQMHPEGSSNPILYPINPVNFVYYMFAGLCIGCLVAYFIYRARKS